jgi:hypothetical protein
MYLSFRRVVDALIDGINPFGNPLSNRNPGFQAIRNPPHSKDLMARPSAALAPEVLQ